MRLIGLVFVLSVAVSPVARGEGEQRDGNALLAKCTQSLALFDRSVNDSDIGMDTAIKASYCHGYLLGLVEMNEAYRKVFKALKVRAALYCVPPAVSSIQAQRVIVKYLKDHPERLHESELFLAISAFQDAFPCAEVKR